MKYIDAKDTKASREYLIRLKELIQQKKEQFFEPSDFVLVKSTNHLPKDGILRPLSEIPFITKTNGLFATTIFELLKEEYMEKTKKLPNVDVLKEERNQYLYYSTKYKDYLRFAINEMNMNMEEAKLEGNHFLLIDPLINHLGNVMFEGMDLENVFVRGDLVLSSKAKLLVDKDRYEDYKVQFPYINQYQIIPYTGNIQKVVSMFMVGNGYIPEDELERDNKLLVKYREYISTLQSSYSIKPFDGDAQMYEKDDILHRMYDQNYYQFLCNKLCISERQSDLIVCEFTKEKSLNEFNIEILKKMIRGMGLERLKGIVDEYNQVILSALERGEYPTNNELLELGISLLLDVFYGKQRVR